MLASVAELRVPVSVTSLVRPRSIGGSRLVRDYLQEVPAALRFFSGSPFQLQTYRAKLAEVEARFGRSERERLAEVLRPYSDRARERLSRFVEEGGAVVTTGQQTGFLTGPLYTVYKALSAVVLANHLEERLDRIVLPVFWIASEDHDWAEVNHAYVLDPVDRLRRVELPDDGENRPIPMSERVLTGQLEELCDEIAQSIAPQPRTQALARRILDPYRSPGKTMAQAFREALAGILGGFDLLFVDAADPVLKKLSAGALKEAVAEAVVEEERLVERTSEIEACGYSAQVGILEGATNVFVYGPQGRQRLYRRGEDYAVRGRKGTIPREDLLAEIEARPERFSPNVLLRPVVESAVLPTLAYVGGPGEIAYFAQATALFECHGIRPPAVVPRFSALVVDDGTEKALNKLGLTEADLAETREALIDRLARREMPPGAREMLEALRRGLVEGFDTLAEQVEGIDPTLVGALGALRNRGLHDSFQAERKIVRALKRREKDRIGQLDRVLNVMQPNGKLQDRVLNPLSFLARYGEHFLPQVESAIRTHWRLPEQG